MEKLLTEKLELVEHLPTTSFENLPKRLFDDCEKLNKKPTLLDANSRSVIFQSPIPCSCNSNNTFSIRPFRAPKNQQSIILTHGLFEENRDIYTFLIKGLNEKGFDVYLTTLPFHYERRPLESSFSGEFFWSADILRTRKAFKQAVYELYQTYHYIKEERNHPVFFAGFSMGASIALVCSALWKGMPPLFAINPAAGLSDIIWDSPLCRTIKKDFLTAGYSMEQLNEIYAPFEPKSMPRHHISKESICLAYGLYDQVTEQYQYDNLIRSWDISQTIPYKAGHLNTLRVPRLAGDMASFFATKENALHAS